MSEKLIPKFQAKRILETQCQECTASVNDEHWKQFYKFPRPNDVELRLALETVNKLIDIERFHLEHAKDKVAYGRRYYGLCEAQSVLNDWNEKP